MKSPFTGNEMQKFKYFKSVLLLIKIKYSSLKNQKVLNFQHLYVVIILETESYKFFFKYITSKS